LFSIVGATKDEYLQLSVVENQILLEAGATKIILPIEPSENYPSPPDYNNAPSCYKLTKEHLSAIAIARNFTNNSETAGLFQFVHITGENIFAFHTNYFYINGSFSELPTASFRDEETAVIGNLENVELAVLQNHHIFKLPDCVYIFTKSETNQMNLKTIFERLRLPGKEFRCDLEELVSFVQLANNVSESAVATCSLVGEGLFVKLKMNDANYSRSLIATPLKAVPGEILNAKTNQNTLIIQNEKEWICFVGMSKN
jgi:hypothetical protein